MQRCREIIRLGVHYPAEVIEIGANYVEEMTTPSIFEHYLLPVHRESAEVLRVAANWWFAI